MFGCLHSKQRVKLNKRRERTKKARHQGRMLVYKGPKACAHKHWMPQWKLAIVKGNMEMKWHPAAKAREAAKLIKEQQIDPGLGWKVQIVMDPSAPPPKAPEPPPPDIINNLSPQVQFLLNQDWKWVEDWELDQKPTP